MEKQHYKFELIPLPYDYDALEPYIDTLTMQLHHDRHLKTYVDNLNATLKDQYEYHTWSLTRLLKYANWLPEEIRTPVKNNGGGVYNHNLFFAGMSPARDTQPSEAFNEKLNETFGGLASFQKEFTQAALSVFGSGYAWLALDRAHNLLIKTTANQDTLLPLELHPVMILDVWEHAYYLKHYNKRADYIDDWFHVVDFSKASRLFEDGLRL